MSSGSLLDLRRPWTAVQKVALTQTPPSVGSPHFTHMRVLLAIFGIQKSVPRLNERLRF